MVSYVEIIGVFFRLQTILRCIAFPANEGVKWLRRIFSFYLEGNKVLYS
jgi:hypothetical protein